MDAMDTDSKEVTMVQQRGHHLYQMLAMNAKNKRAAYRVEERASCGVNYGRLWRQFIKDGKQLLWQGSATTGIISISTMCRSRRLFARLPRANGFCSRHQRVDDKKGEIYFSAGGVNRNEDPYLVHYYKIGMDGKNMVALTPEEGNHSVHIPTITAISWIPILRWIRLLLPCSEMRRPVNSSRLWKWLISLR